MRDFKNLNTLQEVQYNHILDKNKARDERLKPIKDYLSNYHIHEIWELNNYQIAKVTRKVKIDDGEIMYATFLNYETLQHFGSTFDHAVLICLAIKYESYNSQFPMYAGKMLNANFKPEYMEDNSINDLLCTKNKEQTEVEDEFEYCEICKQPLMDEDDVYEGICNYCGDGNFVKE